MHGKILFLLGLVLLVGLAVVAIRSSWALPEGALGTAHQLLHEQDDLLAAEALHAEASGTAQAPADKARRQELSKNAAGDSKSFYFITGRCVAAEDGLPLPGCKVVLNDRWNLKLNLDAIPLHFPQTVSDEHGFFRLELQWEKHRHPPLVFFAPHRVTLAINSWKVDEREQWELGDVALPLGSRVRLQILDQGSLPVRGVQVTLIYQGDLAPLVKSKAEPLRTIQDFSDAAGVVHFGQNSLSPGDWKIRVSEFQPPKEFPALSILPGQKSVERTLVLEVPSKDIVAGVIMDEEGKPMAGRTLQVSCQRARRLRPGSNTIYMSTKILADGFFRVQRSGEKEPQSLHVVDQPEYEELHFPGPLPWGRTDLHLVMHKKARPDPQFHLRVLEASTGKPVLGYGLRFYASPWTSSPLQRPQAEAAAKKVILHGRHEDGRVSLACLPEYSHALTIYPHKKNLACNGIAFVDTAASGDTDFTLLLFPKVKQSVRLLHTDGQPVVGCEVQLLRWMSRNTGGPSINAMLHGFIVPVEYAYLPSRRTKGWPNYLSTILLQYDRGLTDHEGRVQLSGPGDGQALLLWAQSEDMQPALEEGVLLQDGAAERVMTVVSSAKLSIQLHPNEHWQRIVNAVGWEAESRQAAIAQCKDRQICSQFGW